MNDPNWADIMSAFGTLAIATTGAWALVQWKNTLQNALLALLRSR